MARRHHWFSGHEFEQSAKYKKLDKVKDTAAHDVTKNRTVLSDWTTTAKKFVCLIHVCIWKPQIPWNYLDWWQIRDVEGGMHVRDVLFGYFAEVILKRFLFFRQNNIRLESRSKNIRLEKYISMKKWDERVVWPDNRSEMLSLSLPFFQEGSLRNGWGDQSVGHSVLSDSLWPSGCSPSGSSVHGILRARILEWVTISFFRGSSWVRHQTPVSGIAGRFFTGWITREDLHASSG